MESRRIRRVRQPTPWQRWVARCHAWLEDTLEKAVCCGVDAESLEAAKRFSMGSKQASAAFSIRSMNAYLGDSEFEDYEDACEALSDTESESADDHLSDSRTSTVDMERQYSCVGEWEEEAGERRRTSVSSEYVPFDDDTAELEDTSVRVGEGQEGRPHSTPTETTEHRESDLLHRCYFNCVLAELLMTSHPAGLWA